MSKKLIKKTFYMGVISALISSVAIAENGFYAGAGAAFLTYSEDIISDDASFTAIYGRIGKNFNQYFSGEIRTGIGVGDDTINVEGVGVNLELDSFLGAYIRGGIPASGNFFPYAIVGYTTGDFTGSIDGFGSLSGSESGLSYGVGADLGLSENLALNIEYMSYIDEDETLVDGFSIGVTKSF